MSRERMGRLVVLAVIAGMLAAGLVRPAVPAGAGWPALGSRQGTPDAGRAAEGSAEAIAHPTGAGVPILRVETIGGLAQPQDLVRRVPRFTLYGDGLAVYVGPAPRTDPPAALPNLRQLRLSEAGIQAILHAARDAGLIGEDRAFGNDEILDAGSVVFAIAAGGRVTTTSVYALGIEIGSERMPADERARFVAATEFWDRLRDPASWLPAEAIVEAEIPFPSVRLQVVSQPLASTGREVGPEAVAVPWPLAPSLADFGRPFAGIPSPFESVFPLEDARCGVIEGDDAAILVEGLTSAGASAVWESDGERYVLHPRPLLPDETGCPPRPFGESGVGTPRAGAPD